MMDIMHCNTGETFIAYGVTEPIQDVEAKEIRFRILNGPNLSIYELAFSDERSFKQLATDNAF